MGEVVVAPDPRDAERELVKRVAAVDGFVRYHADEKWVDRQPRYTVVVDELQALRLDGHLDDAVAARGQLLHRELPFPPDPLVRVRAPLNEEGAREVAGKFSEGCMLRMPARLTDVMTFVRDHDRFRVGDLAPWLDEGSRMVVTRRLVREGLLRIDS